jgi:hypothetical protein
MCITVEVQERHYLSGSHTATFSKRVHWICKNAENQHKMRRFIFVWLLIYYVIYLPTFIILNESN